MIAAGGDHTLAAIWSPLVQYPVDVTKDLLLIYNTNSIDSSNVCFYYLANRPMVGSCSNVLAIGCPTSEQVDPIGAKGSSRKSKPGCRIIQQNGLRM